MLGGEIVLHKDGVYMHVEIVLHKDGFYMHVKLLLPDLS